MEIVPLYPVPHLMPLPPNRCILSYVNHLTYSFPKGLELQIQNLKSPISVSIPISTTQEEDVTYQCKFWDKTMKTWSTSGVDSSADYQRGVITHLSTFAVFSTNHVLTTTTNIETSPTADATEIPTTTVRSGE